MTALRAVRQRGFFETRRARFGHVGGRFGKASLPAHEHTLFYSISSAPYIHYCTRGPDKRWGAREGGGVVERHGEIPGWHEAIHKSNGFGTDTFRGVEPLRGIYGYPLDWI